jgi:hypothetical protein
MTRTISRKAALRTITASTVTLGLLGLGMGTAGAATPDTKPLGSSSSERVENLTSYEMRLVNITGDGNFEGRPADGTTYLSGRSADFEVQRKWMRSQHDVAHFEFLDGNGARVGTGDLDLRLSGGVFDSTMSFTPTTTGLPVTSDVNGEQNVLTLTDSGATTHDVDASDPRGQAVLKALDGDSSDITWNFTPEKKELTTSPTTVLGAAVDNATGTPNSTQITRSNTVTSTNTVGVELGAKLKLRDVLELQLKINFSHTWTNSTTFNQTVNTTIPAWTEAWLTAAEPTLTFTGTVTATFGKSVWTIRNAQFTDVDPDPARQGVLVINYRSLTTGAVHQVPVTTAMLAHR